VGLSSAVLFDKENPFNPVNRRISIIVMNKKAEEAAQKDGGSIELDAENGNPQQAVLEGAGALPIVSAVATGLAPAPVMASAPLVTAPVAQPVEAAR